MIDDLVERRVAELMTTMSCGETSHSDYDAGWVARVRKPSTEEPAFPEVLDVVRARQREDGSWGPEVPYASARVLSTLSSVLALMSTSGPPEDARRVQRGVAYLCREWERVVADPALSIGFELLVATLLQEACRSGLRELEAFLPGARELRARKLARIPKELIYSRKLSVGYSLEFIGADLDGARAKDLLLDNGSIAGNVAATAFYYSMTGDPTAYEFLVRCVARWGANAIPYGEPADLFPRIWILHNLETASLIDAQDPAVQAHVDVIERAFGPGGVGWSTLIDYGDADDTGMGLVVLAWSGRTPDWQVLRSYEGEERFRTYFGENDASTSANAHVLLALAVAERTPWVDAAIAKVIGFLRGQRTRQGCWTDKWHASPYYATACVIEAFVQAGHEHELAVSHEWVLATQRDDGSWGYFDQGSPEETSYALAILLASSDRTKHPIPPGVVERAIAYLSPFVGDRWNADMEPLWINKTLYTPKQVVQSVILHAFVLAQHHLRG